MDYTFKIITVGDIYVGKTSIVNRYISNTFNENYNLTIGVNFACKTININNNNIKIQIWDTSGEEQFRSIINMYFINTIGILLIFDISNINTFNNIQSRIYDINKNNNPRNPIIILVGNKNDKLREVNFEQAQKFALDNSLIYIETSAKTGFNINKIFDILIYNILNL